MSRKRGTFDPTRLKVQNTEDVRPRIEPMERTGNKFKMGVNQFVYHLLVVNEKFPVTKKMTDAEISRQVCEEFSRYKDTVRYWGKSSNVHTYRLRFMRGQLGPSKGTPPEVISFRYNNKGQRVHRGRVMDEAAIMKYRAQWTARWYDLVEEFPRPWFLPKTDPEVTKAHIKAVRLSTLVKSIIRQRRRNLIDE